MIFWIVLTLSRRKLIIHKYVKCIYLHIKQGVETKCLIHIQKKTHIIIKKSCTTNFVSINKLVRLVKLVKSNLKNYI